MNQQTSQATNATSEAQRGLRYRVLIVEDDADIRELIRYNLAQEGFIVEEAADGAQALEKVKRRVPDLMVLDLMLPGTPGLQVCRQMRAERETAHLPILIVTAKGTEVDKVLGLEMGADDYVVKPFSPRELVARVKALLRRANPLSEPDSGGGAYEKGRLRMDFGTYQGAGAARVRAAEVFCAASDACVYARTTARHGVGTRHVRRTADRRRSRPPPAPAYRARRRQSGADPHGAKRRISFQPRSAWIDRRPPD
jgi:CheY-like chemotaxis protein